MSLLGNILWLICGGFLVGVGYILGGIVLCLTIVGLPFGMQAIKLGVATMAPFGKTVVIEEGGMTTLAIVLNVVWAVCLGWGIAVAHATSALACAITIIGIPFAIQHLKLIPVALLPFSHRLE